MEVIVSVFAVIPHIKKFEKKILNIFHFNETKYLAHLWSLVLVNVCGICSSVLRTKYAFQLYHVRFVFESHSKIKNLD